MGWDKLMNKKASISELQEQISTLIDKYQLSRDINIRYIDLTSEVGEVGKEILISSNYGNVKEKDIHYSKDLSMEIGDSLFSLFFLCISVDIDLEYAIHKVLQKYENRFEKNKTIGSKK